MQTKPDGACRAANPNPNSLTLDLDLVFNIS